MKLEYQENPTEEDFPLIDRCVECGEICDWQPRYEIFARLDIHNTILTEQRPLNYTPEYRVVKICAGCIPNDNQELRRLIRQHYPVYAQEKGI